MVQMTRRVTVATAWRQQRAGLSLRQVFTPTSKTKVTCSATPDSLRSGEGYFSADGRELIYQSEQAGDNPFYQIFVLDLASGVSRLVSPGVGLTTCAWIHPTQDLVMYSSTHEDPNAQAKQAEEIAIRESGIERAYGWDYDRHYDIYIANSDGSGPRNISNAEGYDAEGSYSADGSQILFASNREAYSRTLSLAE